MATAADGTHPTAMHSRFFKRLVLLQHFISERQFIQQTVTQKGWFVACNLNIFALTFSEVPNETGVLYRLKIKSLGYLAVDDLCVGVECHNGGTCEIGLSGSEFSCKCPENYAGELWDSKEKLINVFYFSSVIWKTKQHLKWFEGHLRKMISHPGKYNLDWFLNKLMSSSCFQIYVHRGPQGEKL